MTDLGQKTSYQDDEIDLIELLVALWKGKVIILMFILCSLAAGFMYLKTVAQVYTVSSKLTVNIHSADAFKFCDNDACLDQDTLSSYAALLQKWSMNMKNSEVSRDLSFYPDDISTYLAELENENDELTQGLLENAKDDLKMALGLPSDLRSTDTVAETVWYSQKTVNLVEEKKVKALSFGDLAVKKQSPKVALTLVLSLLLGGMLGVFAVLLKKPFIEIKSRFSKDL